MTRDTSPTTRESCWAQAFALLAEQESFARTELDAPAQTARRALASMEAVGLVERVGAEKSGAKVEWHRGDAWAYLTSPPAGHSIVWDADSERLRPDKCVPSEQSTLEDAS